MDYKVDPRFREYEEEKLFHLIFKELWVHLLVHPCSMSEWHIRYIFTLALNQALPNRVAAAVVHQLHFSNPCSSLVSADPRHICRIGISSSDPGILLDARHISR